MEWIRITKSTGEMFSCPLNGWLENGEGNSETVNCTSSGHYFCHLCMRHQNIALWHMGEAQWKIIFTTAPGLIILLIFRDKHTFAALCINNSRLKARMPTEVSE